jgi:hypothetical protein
MSSSQKTEYAALSYVWGIQMSPQQVMVNSRTMCVTANLDCALRHLRYPQSSRVLWVDALCINQTNNLERNSQIQMMGNIYSSASTVLIWLGPGEDDDEELIDKMAKPRRWEARTLRALIRIIRRPRFTRVWV